MKGSFKERYYVTMKKTAIFNLISVALVIFMCGFVWASEYDYEKTGTFGDLKYGIYQDELYIRGCNNSVESIIIPSEIEGYPVKNLSFCSFEGCEKLASITISDSVTFIDPYAFQNLANLTSITVNSDNNNYVSENGILFNKDKTTIICYPSAKKETSYAIPDSVTSISYIAFEGCTNLISVSIPESVTSIEYATFSGCTGLSTITIPDSITNIGNSAFYGCDALTSITIPGSVAYIGYNAFDGCTSLESIIIPDSVTSIESSAFCNTAYYDNNNNWIDDVLYIGNHLIKAETSVSGSYSVKSGTRSISSTAFENCVNITSVVMPDSVTVIGDGAFYGCSGLESIAFSDSLTSIGAFAFNGCTNLVSVSFPESVMSIGRYAFSNCTSLTSVTLPDGVSIDGGIFSGCSGLISVTIPDGITNIVSQMFDNCSSLASVIIPNSVTSIGDHAFFGCDSLTSIYIPDSIASIGYAFGSCESLTAINVDENNGYYASENGVLFNKDVSTLLHYPSAKSDKSYIIPNSVKSIDGGFSSCQNLTSVTIPYGVTSLNSIFSNCGNLTSLVIPDSVTSVSILIWGCPKLSTIYYLGTEDEWKKIENVDRNTELLKAKIVFCKTLTDDENAIFLRIGENNAFASGKVVANDVAPMIANSRTMLPARFVAEQLGATVAWKETGVGQGQVTITNESTTIVITIGSNIAIVNGKEIQLDSPAFIRNGRTYTPVRFICENLGAKVNWDDKTQTVIITKA